jgi:2-polyprenyl-3-methyl-5-hydroxy-6-metoxy-1,4-benzoquinol methylase
VTKSVTKADVAETLARLYTRRSLQGYVRWKVRTDPAYSAALEALRDRNQPLIDVGCGVGLLAFYLRENGYTAPIIGIDFDERKIEVARVAATRYRGIDFISGDAREPLPEGHDVVLLDILHYFDRDSQQRILANAARAVGPDGMIVIRQGIRDGSWRHRLTLIVDGLARVFRWMKAERLVFPSREEILGAFDGFEAEVRPLWGNMPYNSYFFVLRRSATARQPE